MSTPSNIPKLATIEIRGRLWAQKRLSSLLVPALVLAIESEFVKPWPILQDASSYFAMANDPFVYMTPEGYTGGPYGYRVLTPLIVHILPVSADLGFKIVTVLSLYFTAVVLYSFLRRFVKLTHRVAILGQVLFLADISIVYNIANFALVDALSYLFLILGLYFAYLQSNVLFAGTVALGILNKETELLLVPMYYLVNSSSAFDLSCLRRTILLSGPSLVCFAALHLLVSGQIEEPWAGLTTLWENLGYSWIGQPVKSVALLVFSWSFLWGLAFAGYVSHCRSGRTGRLICLMPFVFALAVFYDISRMLAYGFPAIAAYSLCTVSAWSKTRRGLLGTILIVVLQIALQIGFVVFILPVAYHGITLPIVGNESVVADIVGRFSPIEGSYYDKNSIDDGDLVPPAFGVVLGGPVS